MTDPVVEPEKTIEYAQIASQIDPFAAKVESLPFRIPIYFLDKEEVSTNSLSEAEFEPIKQNFPEIVIPEDYHEVYVACTVMKSYFSALFQTKDYCFFFNFPFVGYASEPFYEEYLGEVSQGRHLLKHGVSEDVLNKMLSIKKVLENKFEQRLAAGK